ncbi:MAG: TRM11 family SAM-dependent methyltransferase, partial [Dehalococcoidia bacterium]
LLICHLRTARRRARTAAIAEALCLLHDLGAHELPGGPLSERGGVFWIGLPAGSLDVAVARLARLGYTSAVDVAEPVVGDGGRQTLVRWRGQAYRLVRVYEEDAAALREAAVDRRTFVLQTRDGETREIRGYRGDSQTLSRRGLPVYDARLLVNVVFRPELGTLLDPFAGAGGIVVETVASGWRTLSADIDPALRHGLARFGAAHWVGDARVLPLATASIDAIATEPPYDATADESVVAALKEAERVVTPGGRIALLCAEWQAAALRASANELGLAAFLDTAIDRKGLPVVVLAWQKPAAFA